MALELGFFIPPVPVDEFTAMAQMAEQAGFDFLTVDDHMIYPFGAPFGEGSDYFGIHEAWTAMTFMAGATSRIAVSHMVLVLTFRGPGMVAKAGATLDLFSKGRMDLTVGAGWFEREFNAFGFPWASHKERLERLYEAVKIIKLLWTEPKVTFEGKYYQLYEAEILPKPYQKPAPPIWIGGDSKRSMKIASDLGDGWLVHGHQPGDIDRMFKAIRPGLGDRAENYGLGMAVFVVMGKDRDEATAKVNQIITPEIWERFQMADIKHELNNRISGSSQQCIEQIKAYQKIGMNRLITIFLDPDDVERFTKEVMPEIR